jgi:hypothetical protein
MRLYRIFFLLLLLSSISAQSREVARPSEEVSTTAPPLYCTATHDVGRLTLIMTNGGMLGTGNYAVEDQPLTPYSHDNSGCHLGEVTLIGEFAAGEYPRGSGLACLRNAAIWIGGITEQGDTLVSVGYSDMQYRSSEPANYEFFPNPHTDGPFLVKSLATDRPSDPARSDQDYIAEFVDTLKGSHPGLQLDFRTSKPHRPLGLHITQVSSQWSSRLVDDFVLIEYRITNVGTQDIHDVYVGLYSEPFFGAYSWLTSGYSHNLCGFLTQATSPIGCSFPDTLNMLWASSSDGMPDYSVTPPRWLESGPFKSVRTALGIRLLSAPQEAYVRGFNWWNAAVRVGYDYGPQHRGPGGLEIHPMGRGSGTPLGDVDKYYLMANGEVDPDIPRILQVLPADPLWAYPPSFARSDLFWGSGYFRTVISVGPFELGVGEVKSVVYAVIGADNFHIDPSNGDHFNSYDIDGWYANVDFSDLVKNAKQAEWVYDNPGYDTDGDGYRGKSHICILDSVLVDSVWIPSVAETTFYAGDGVPDWRAVGPPPAPKFWLYPYDKGIRVRFNGLLSETTKDLVSNRIDFEGYRIYLGRDDREASLSVAAGYDQKNYDKFVYNPKIYPSGGFEVQETPFTLDRLRCLYGLGDDPCHDSLFDPLAYTAGAPYRLPGHLGDSIFYFVQHGHNAGRLGIDTPIRRLYPNSLKPIPGEPIPDSAYTEDGYLKYYEYECIIDGLLPTVPYFVNVTAFDFGDPAGGVEALESSKLLGLQDCYALENANQTGAKDKPVYIYPNPYRADAKYREMGYEGRGSDRINDRERRIHFANLPAKCWIRIHTLDGDMVREIRHDMDPNDPASDHDTWDMINRNIMAVESGLYYWSVEPDDGKVQIGKLVIIR